MDTVISLSLTKRHVLASFFTTVALFDFSVFAHLYGLIPLALIGPWLILIWQQHRDKNTEGDAEHPSAKEWREFEKSLADDGQA